MGWIVLTRPLGRFGVKPKTFQVQMQVDFGPARPSPFVAQGQTGEVGGPGNQASYEGTLEVEKGMTPKDAVSLVFPVRSGMGCCSLRELIEIDGIAIDPAKNRWWNCSINGERRKVSPHNTKLKSGDRVSWQFSESAQ